jgi:hypothetical protein
MGNNFIRNFCKFFFPEKPPEKTMLEKYIEEYKDFDHYRVLNTKVTGYDIGDPRWDGDIR